MPMFAQEGFHVLGELQVGSPEGSAEPAHAMRRQEHKPTFTPEGKVQPTKEQPLALQLMPQCDPPCELYEATPASGRDLHVEMQPEADSLLVLEPTSNV